MRRDVRLLLIGDGKPGIQYNPFNNTLCLEGVGKSTIITSLLTESFTENVRNISFTN